jgi:hypothetical protein
MRDGVQPRAGSTGENNAFARHIDCPYARCA